MEPSTDCSTLPRSRRRRRGPLIITVVALIASGALAALQPPASAAIKSCPDGSPPPCDIPDPDPPPTTTPPPPPTNVWSATVSVLDQHPAGFRRGIIGSWGRVGSPSYSTPSGTVVWSDAAKTEGTVSLTSTYLPAGAPVGFRLRETTGSSGHLCRSPLQPTVSPTGRSVHVLVAPTITRTPANLSAMVAGFSGRVTPDPAGAEVTISSTTLVPQPDGLLLTVRGRLWKDVQFPAPNADATFAYAVVLHLSPSTSLDPAQVLSVRADPGILQLTGDGWTDNVLIALAGDVEPDFRKAVVEKATASVNASVAADPQVGWFRSLGYTVSVRNVTTTPNGVAVDPSLCKVA